MTDGNSFFLRNIAGQWNQVFVQSLPEEEVNIRDDQDPRVSGQYNTNQK